MLVNDQDLTPAPSPSPARAAAHASAQRGRRLRRGVTAVVAALGMLVVVSGCAAQKTPTSYTDSVEKHWMGTCTKGANGATPPSGSCQCAYDQIKKNVKFSVFKKANDNLEQHQNDPMPSSLSIWVQACKTGTFVPSAATESASSSASTSSK